ncbi:MAG TPA: aldose 1-epimerase [Acidimicrobiia bacterium]|nr:aldose 1-epimerase [Acidimicrobiia bacterium]
MVTIACGSLAATFVPELGMVGASLRHDGTELLALPEGIDGYRARRQAGLPLLAPWANRLGSRRFVVAGVPLDLGSLDLTVDEHDLPIHGTMTAVSGWSIVDQREDRVLASFDYGAHPDLLVAYPFPHRLELDATVRADRLTVRTTIEPTSDRVVPVSFGFHPYFQLADAPRGSWLLELPEREHAVLDDRSLPTGTWIAEPAERATLGTRTFDDLYAIGHDRQLAVAGGGRRIAIELGDAYPFAQVYAPRGGEFVCLEPMTAATNALVDGTAPLVAPGERFTAEFSIVVR